MTPEQAKEFLALRLTPKIRRGLTATDFTEAWLALTAAQKLAIVNASVEGRDEDAGKHLAKMLNAYAKAQAEIRADAMVADGSLDISEFSEVFD